MLSKVSPALGGTAPSYSTSQLRYPETNFNADTDYVKIRFFDYVAPFSAEAGNTITNAAGPAFAAYNGSNSSLGKETATMYLYMPEDMDGQYGGNWSNTNLSTAARGILSGFGKGAVGDLGGTFGDVVGTGATMVENAVKKGTAAVSAMSEMLSKTNFGSLTVNEIYAGTTGQILNPNTEVLYTGPKMRTFGLSFKMAPRNAREAENIKNIIHVFKYATLPKYGGAGDLNASFVKVPQLVDVTFMKGNEEHPWVTQYKPSVITDFSVSYTPDGAWATLPNGSPVATSIKISFNETKMVYADEISKSGATY